MASSFSLIFVWLDFSSRIRASLALCDAPASKIMVQMHTEETTEGKEETAVVVVVMVVVV